MYEDHPFSSLLFSHLPTSLHVALSCITHATA
jgi:hypothetical protein